MVQIAIVVPCYNEEEVLPETARRLTDLLDQLVSRRKVSPDSKIYFVDDGSQDRSWSIIEDLAKQHPHIHGIKLSRNHGHQYALLCGLMSADGDAVISVDADLQDDLNAIGEMLDAFAQGCEVVYGVRSSRTTDTAFKRYTARSYYWLLRSMGVDLVVDHADFRLLSRRAVEALRSYQESNLFLRGIIPKLGFKAGKVYYERQKRFAGESKYPLRKMASLALDGITSFSPVPLRIIAALGFLVTFLSAFLGMWTIAMRLFSNATLPGWASTVVPIYFLGGLQLLGIGMIGEYLARVYIESKRRPRYIVEKTTPSSLE